MSSKHGHGFTLAAALLAAGCGGGQSSVLDGVSSIVYIQRSVTSLGDTLQYVGGGTDGNLFTLTPPSATGKRVNLTNWKGGDVNGLDVSFDAREILFAGRAPGDQQYHLFRVNVDGSNPCDAAAGKKSLGPCQVTAGPNNEADPIYLPGGRIMYVTDKSVDGPGVPQFVDEYERGTAGRLATVTLDGGDEQLGASNVSHRVSPALMSDGRVVFSEWFHLGDQNNAPLATINQDLTNVREGFGRQGTGAGASSYRRAQEISPGRLVTIATSRDRTYQAGKLMTVDLGGTDVSQQSELRSKYVDLTPDVPIERNPSFPGVGRFYDVMPVGAPAQQRFLVSWADGPVETMTLGYAKSTPDFGIYVYDATNHTRTPVYNEVGTWEVSPRPIVKRAEPPALAPSFGAQGTQSTLVSAVNVYDSTVFPNLTPGSVVKVRLSEGFSTEEGAPGDFGISDFDGMSRLGDVDLAKDGSFKALVPANDPVRIQLIDKYGMAVASEPAWISGRPGEARVCGGCHEDRTKSLQLTPGSSQLQALGAVALDSPGVPRLQRKSMDFSPDKLRGVPWDKAVQPIFDAHCVDCHDGTNNGANPSYNVVGKLDMSMKQMVFDLTSKPVAVMKEGYTATYSASHVTLLTPSSLMMESQFMVTGGAPPLYVKPGSGRDSVLLQRLNPPARYPSLNTADRAFGNKPVHPQDVGTIAGHNGSDPKYALTPDEYFILQVMCDAGGQYYTRENIPGGSGTGYMP